MNIKIIDTFCKNTNSYYIISIIIYQYLNVLKCWVLFFLVNVRYFKEKCVL